MYWSFVVEYLAKISNKWNWRKGESKNQTYWMVEQKWKVNSNDRNEILNQFDRAMKTKKICQNHIFACIKHISHLFIFFVLETSILSVLFCFLFTVIYHYQTYYVFRLELFTFDFKNHTSTATEIFNFYSKTKKRKKKLFMWKMIKSAKKYTLMKMN